MTNDGLTVLVEAKKEYMAQLCAVLCPQMIETFELMYTEAMKMSKGKQVLQQFQKLLREVKNWSNTMIGEHEAKLKNTCGFLDDLIAAVFVSYVKILSSVRLNSTDKKMSVKMPQTDIVIHACFKAAANDLYKSPYIYHDDMSEYQRDEELVKRFVETINEAIKKLLPVQEILLHYMKAESEEQQEEPEEKIPPEEEPAPEEPVPEGGEGGEAGEGTPESGEGGPPTEGTAPEGAPAPEQPDTSRDAKPPLAPIEPGDVKNINLSDSADNDVLFPDARD